MYACVYLMTKLTREVLLRGGSTYLDAVALIRLIYRVDRYAMNGAARWRVVAIKMYSRMSGEKQHCWNVELIRYREMIKDSQ